MRVLSSWINLHGLGSGILTLSISVLFLTEIGLRTKFEINSTEVIAHASNFYSVDLSGRHFGPLVLRSDTEKTPQASTLILRENGMQLGPSHSIHADISGIGLGRYSVWLDTLIFSTSDNSDPRVNNRTYAAEAPLQLRQGWRYIAAIGLLISAILFRKILFCLLKPVLPFLSPLILIFLTFLSPLILIFLIGESYLRTTSPFMKTTWPTTWKHEVGFIFKPEERVSWTNHSDFWTSELTNSDGFLDRESTVRMESDCHIAFLGDSFVEAAQVALVDKSHIRLETMAREQFPHWSLRTSAYGISGTGQLNQIPLYDEYISAVAPNLLVLVLVSNDFANNSALLESVRYGWHPEYSPRAFAVKDAFGQISEQPISIDWKNHRFVSKHPTLESTGLNRAWIWLEKNSYFAAWLQSNIRLQFAQVLKRSSERKVQSHLDWLSVILPRAMEDLSQWDTSIHMDRVFYERELPAAFQDALDFTGFALRQLKNRAEERGGHIVMLATADITLRTPDKSDADKQRRYFQRFQNLASENSIQLLDQYSWIKAEGLRNEDLTFRLDNHWNELGHQTAAQMVLEYLQQNPHICASASH